MVLRRLSRDAINTSSYTTYTSGGNLIHRGTVLGTTNRNVQRILECKWHGEKRLTPIRYDELEDVTKWWDDNTSRPLRYHLRKKFLNAGTELNQLLWFPGSDAAYDLRYWIEARATKLVNTSDVPLMPPQFHYGIVAGAIARLAEYSVEVESQVIWPGVYKKTIDDMLEFNRKWWEQNDPFKSHHVGSNKPYML